MRIQLRPLGRVAIALTLAGITRTSLHGQLVAPTELVSVTTIGAAGGMPFGDFSIFGAALSNMTPDNRYVVFSSASPLVAGTNGVQQVFVRDRQTGVTTLVSRASDGTLGNMVSGYAVISANARYIAFISAATNLVANDTNLAVDPITGPIPGSGDDVFVRDLLTNTTVRASVSSAGAQATRGVNRLPPAISGDGRLVVFSSISDNLVSGDTNVSDADVFLRDMVTGTTERVSVRPDGSEIIGSDALQPTISADGRRVAFAVFNNALAGPTPQVPPNLHEGIYVRDLGTGATILVSALPDGTPAHRNVNGQQFPMISANGRYVSFNSWDDLDPAFPDSVEERALFDGVKSDVFVRDLETSTTRRASMPFPGGAAEESGSMATISADGRFVAYTNSQNVTTVRDMITDTSVVAQLPDASIPDVGSPRISPDARFLYAESFTDIDARDTNHLVDAYLFTLPPHAGADLSLTLSASTTQPAPESDLTLTVEVANGGGQDASGVTVAIPLPAGFTLVSQSGDGSYVGGTWTIGALGSGSTASVALVVHVAALSPTSITAQIMTAAPFDPDSTPGNSVPTEDDEASVTFSPVAINLSLSLNPNTLSPPVNSNVTLTAVVSDSGAPATGVAVAFPLPAGLVFVSSSGAGTYDSATGVWTIGAIASGGAHSLQLVARVTALPPVDVTAQVSAANEVDVNSTPNNNVVTEDDQATVHLTPVVAGIIVNDPTGAVNPNDGKCTLVEAIIAANTDAPSGNAVGECTGGSGPDTIYLRALTPPYSFRAIHNTTNGFNALPAVTSDITIEADGQIIERSPLPGTPAFRLFEIEPTGRLVLHDAVVRNGYGIDPTFLNVNAVFGGAIESFGILEINGGALTGNHAACDGGAIAAFGPLLVHGHALIQGNIAECSGGGIATLFAGAVNIDDSIVEQNSAAFGGGIYIHGRATAIITNSTVRNNVVISDGGGIFTFGGDANMAIADTQILNNTTTSGHGGGISNGQLQPGTVGTVLVSGGAMQLTNVVVSGNTTNEGYGGGVANAGSLTMTASTVSGNRARSVAANSGGGGLYSATALIVSNSLLTGNSATPVGGGLLTSSVVPAVVANTTISANTADIGGGIYASGQATFTALNIINNVATRFGGGIATNSGYWLGGSTVRGNRAGVAGGGLHFTDSLAVVDGTTIEQNQSVTGGGLWATGGAIWLQGGTRVLSNTATNAGGGIALTTATLTMTGGLIDGNVANGDWSLGGGGGGISSQGSTALATLYQVVISNNRAPNGGDGGGVLNSGNFIMFDGELRGNTAQAGGALSNGTSLTRYGPATLTNVSVSQNQATFAGGAFFVATPAGTTGAGYLNIAGGIIENNSAFDGGGIYNLPASTVNVLAGTRLRANTATNEGGAIRSAGALNIDGTYVQSNGAVNGAGLFLNGPATITNSTFAGNTARVGGGISVVASSLPLFAVDIRNSTVTSNVATGAGAGGIELAGPVDNNLANAMRLGFLTVVNNTGTPGGINNGTTVSMLNTVLVGNYRPDLTVSECGKPGGTGLFSISSNLVGQDPSCPLSISISNPGAPGFPHRVVDPSALFATILSPLADNGGPTPTHALLPGSPALDFAQPGQICPNDQRGLPRPADGDGDGSALCDVGAFEQQIPLPSPVPTLVSLTPATASANGSAQSVAVTGTRFMPQSVALWNGSPRSTVVNSTTGLSISLPATDLATSQPLITGLITVTNPATASSNPLAFTIVGPLVSRARSVAVAAGATATVSTFPIGPGQSGVAASLSNSSGPSAAALTVATYLANPVGGTVFAAGGFFDVQVTGADPSDSVDARFYYPNTVTVATEASLQLLFWTGTAWAPVVGSGGTLPTKDTTDDLDGTISGGRFALTFDNTSTPSIMALGGTIFALATPAVAESLDGRMFGVGFINQGRQHHHFVFRVGQLRSRDYGRFEYWSNEPRFCGRDDDESDGAINGDHDRDYGRDHRNPANRFEATSIGDVTFSDDRAFKPGRTLRPTVDTVRFTGTGRWNGRPGYTFEVLATDQGEPGRRRDTFSLVVKDPSGKIVTNVSDALDGGNIQSTRLMK